MSHLYNIPTPLIIFEARTNGVTTEVSRYRPHLTKAAFTPENFWADILERLEDATLKHNPDEVVVRFLRPVCE